ncbi:hypothetical protein JZX76_11450, partial [Haloarcula hispanica]|uniref:hypothetical protein n=1 Tax=Haloarcula hispanica TaxID=51589 RepID=UPI001A913911
CYRDVQNRGMGDKELIPCIAFSRTPSDRFSGYLDFLQAKGIEVLWIEDETVTGHPESADRILK